MRHRLAVILILAWCYPALADAPEGGRSRAEGDKRMEIEATAVPRIR